jgi:hypothetical protein
MVSFQKVTYQIISEGSKTNSVRLLNNGTTASSATIMSPLQPIFGTNNDFMNQTAIVNVPSSYPFTGVETRVNNKDPDKVGQQDVVKESKTQRKIGTHNSSLTENKINIAFNRTSKQILNISYNSTVAPTVMVPTDNLQEGYPSNHFDITKGANIPITSQKPFRETDGQYDLFEMYYSVSANRDNTSIVPGKNLSEKHRAKSFSSGLHETNNGSVRLSSVTRQNIHSKTEVPRNFKRFQQFDGEYSLFDAPSGGTRKQVNNGLLEIIPTRKRYRSSSLASNYPLLPVRETFQLTKKITTLVTPVERDGKSR